MLGRLLAILLTVVSLGPPAQARMAFDPAATGRLRALSAATAASPSAPFSLSQLPPGSVLEYDVSSAVTTAADRTTSWPARLGTGQFTASTTAEQPLLVRDGWAPGRSVLRCDGAASGSILRGSESLLDRWWNFIVARRSSSDQNAVATFKHVLESGRLADNYGTLLLLQRTLADAPQDKIYVTGFGSSSGPAAISGFGRGARAVLWERADPVRSAAVNGTAGGSPTNNTTSTRTATKLCGSDDAVSNRAGIDIVRRVRLNTDLLPGKAQQLATGYLVEGRLAWDEGTQASLRPDHPYKNRPPLASDYSGQNRHIQIWGNSLANYIGSQLPNVIPAAALGFTITNGGVGGEQSPEINTRFLAGQDQGASSSGLPLADQRAKIVILGEAYQNDQSPPSGKSYVDIATTRANIAGWVAAVEAAQGAAPGQGRIVVIGKWEGNGGGTGQSAEQGIADARAEKAYLRATYPLYFLDLNAEYAKRAAPGGSHPDAVAYAEGKMPAVLRAPDVTHMSTTQGALVGAQIIRDFLELRGWLR